MGRKKTVKVASIEEILNEAARKESAPAEANLTHSPKEEKPRPVGKIRKRTSQKTRSKKYNAILKKIEKNKLYDLSQAIELCQQISTSKFTGSLELHLNLALEPGNEGQRIRTTASLPHATGKKIVLIAFVDQTLAKGVVAAGADLIGNDKTIEGIAEKGQIKFTSVVATPEFMPKLARIAKILGPKGLMPSPKNGTVTAEPEKIIAELKKGKIEIKTEANAPIIHLSLGKLSLSTTDLKDNFEAAIKAIKEAKPTKAKADFLLSAYLSPTMGPSVKVDLSP